jgi:hypothetical protein
MVLPSGADNIIAALEHNNRLCEVDLWNTRQCQLEKVLAAMQVPFPDLAVLRLTSFDETPPVISDSFLGGSFRRAVPSSELRPRLRRWTRSVKQSL